LQRGISDSEKGYQPRTNIGKIEKGGLVTDCHIILGMWRKHFFQILNVHWFNNIRQTEIHTAGQLVPETGAVEFETVIEKLKRHKTVYIDQIQG